MISIQAELHHSASSQPRKNTTDLQSELNNTPIISGQELLFKDFENSTQMNKSIRR